MILLRGIKGKEYACKIKDGIVDCRDVLSALLKPPVTGYEYSDYYEKNLVKALAYFTKFEGDIIHNPGLLSLLFKDYIIPHIYLTYFHILNANSVKWLGNFEEDYSFIAINVRLDKITENVIGEEYFGSRMYYVDSIKDLKQDEVFNNYASCMCSIENLFKDKSDMGLLLPIYNTLFFPLLCREMDEKFTDIENEFRIIAYDCPRIYYDKWEQIPRKATITLQNGNKYTGELLAKQDTQFISKLRTVRNLSKNLDDIIQESNGYLELDSKFKSISIENIAEEYKYIGGKKECEEYIKKILENPPKQKYVNRTVNRVYKREEVTNVRFISSYAKVDY